MGTVSNSDLANTVAAIIASLLGGAASGTAEATANRVYSEISRRLRKSPRSAAAFSAFEANPKSVEAKRKLTHELIAEFKVDETFRQHISTLINQDHSQTSNKQSVTGSNNKLTGRDDNSRTSTTTKKGVPGSVVAIVVVAIVALVIFLGRGAINLIQTWSKDATYSGLSGQSTCKEFLAADPSAQTAIMKKLYLDRDKMQSAGDPFLLQNAQYSCGSSSSANKTLSEMADKGS